MVYYIDFCQSFTSIVDFFLDPVKPQCYYISIGLKGFNSTRRCLHDVPTIVSAQTDENIRRVSKRSAMIGGPISLAAIYGDEVIVPPSDAFESIQDTFSALHFVTCRKMLNQSAL